MKRLIEGRFRRLKLKDQQIESTDPASDDDIDLIKRHLRDLFLGLDLTKLLKSTTRKNTPYQDWFKKHCKETQFAFQVRKCGDRLCCLEPRLPAEQLFWLPDPIADENNEGHYKPYSVAKGEETTEADRPSLKLGAKNLESCTSS